MGLLKKDGKAEDEKEQIDDDSSGDSNSTTKRTCNLLFMQALVLRYQHDYSMPCLKVVSPNMMVTRRQVSPL